MTGPTPQTPYESRDTFRTPDPADLSQSRPTGWSAWDYREDSGVTGAALAGYRVEATDGHIGKVDSASTEVGAGYLVVDTGPWIFGKKVLLPAGVVNNVDHDDHKVYVDRTKEQIKSAPEFDEERHGDPVYRDKIGSYYGDSYTTPSQIAPPRA
ncbi:MULTISPECIES: PRC-barrel domain-containing protein [Catenuloplanes]|uniref:PRC-barrel domain-containing protein n=1 Tax=Catenuloplanes niger TaxID=587534 RepID=A0AAE3ZRX1_9ACTN|nr:PRC-barrel domain-containing protein [Catenuloplanes niger]MDR7324802.1 hypothetical protein [Catenuloplanes niger]